MKTIRYWIEAMRLRTLPVSLAGVVAAAGLAIWQGTFQIVPTLLCLLFATLAQIASNFANEYYDFRAGLDAPGRDGPRRGVTEGDITPRAMLTATYMTLAAACVTGLALLAWGGPWLIAAGVLVALGVVAYSTGPFPLSHNGLGEIAVIFFFGIIPVNLTCYLQSGILWTPLIFTTSISIGLMGANVLIVNNYRDADADRAVGKKTLAVIWGRPVVRMIYLFNGIAAIALMWPLWADMPALWPACPALYLALHAALWLRLGRAKGAALNPLLGMTAMLMALYSILFLAASCCYSSAIPS